MIKRTYKETRNFESLNLGINYFRSLLTGQMRYNLNLIFELCIFCPYM